MGQREKSQIEIMLEDEIEKIKKELKDFKRLSNYNRSSSKGQLDDLKRLEEIKKELSFLESLLFDFKSLEDNRVFEESETYDEFLMKYVLRNLDPKMSDRLVRCINSDKEKLRREKEKKLEERRDKKIKAIIERNTTSDVKRFYYSGFTSYIKGKFDQSKKNNAIKSYNSDKYRMIISWIENNFVSRYALNVSGKTYYCLKTGGGKVIRHNQSYQYYDKYEQDKIKSRTLYKDEIEKCEELLQYSSLSNDEKKKIQKYLDLLKEGALLFQLTELMREMGINEHFTDTIKERGQIRNELVQKLKNVKLDIANMQKSINIDVLYKNRKEEIENKKAETKKAEKEKEESEKPYVDESILISNNKWEKEYIERYIERELGRKLTIDDTYSEQYHVASRKAKEELSYYLDSLDKELKKYFVTYLEKELAKFILENYKISDQKEIDFIVRDAMLSPEERYIRDMIEAKKLPLGTRTEELTSKDYELIEKHKDRFFDDECDKKIKELKEKIKKINSISFTSIYRIEDVEGMVNQARSEDNSFELARSHFKR